MRYYKALTEAAKRYHIPFYEGEASAPIRLEELPAPLPITKVSPDQLIEDILISTLRRVQENSSPAVSAAAARYITLLSQNAL
jgi:hypothetical protein